MRQRNNLFFLLFSALFYLSLNGCSLKDAPYSPSEADAQFLKIMREEFKLSPVVRMAGDTLWVYSPGKRDIFVLKAGQKAQSSKAKTLSVEYLEGKFDNGIFNYEYDIISAVKSSENNSVANSYSDAFNAEYSRVASALQRSYFNLPSPPIFIVLVIADTQNGVEVVNTFTSDDYKKFQTGVLPYEEYLLRVLNETKGDARIINDTEGKHLDFKEVTWGDFLCRQTVGRINFKYQQSDFPPAEEAGQTLKKIIAETFANYSFRDFSGVELHDLRSGAKEALSPSELASFLK